MENRKSLFKKIGSCIVYWPHLLEKGRIAGWSKLIVMATPKKRQYSSSLQENNFANCGVQEVSDRELIALWPHATTESRYCNTSTKDLLVTELLLRGFVRDDAGKWVS